MPKQILHKGMGHALRKLNVRLPHVPARVLGVRLVTWVVVCLVVILPVLMASPTAQGIGRLGRRLIDRSPAHSGASRTGPSPHGISLGNWRVGTACLGASGPCWYRGIFSGSSDITPQTTGPRVDY